MKPSAAEEVRVRFVAGIEEIDEDLWRRCYPPPIEGQFWYHCLQESGLEQQFRFHYAEIRALGEPVGIVPCFVHDVPMELVAPESVATGLRLLAKMFPGAARQRTFFIGSPCSEEGTIGLVPGVALRDVIAVVGGAVREKARELAAPMIVFKDFPGRDLTAFRALLGAGGFFPMVSYPGTVLTLPEPDKEAYWRALGHNQRHNFLKKLRQSKELLALETVVSQRPSDTELREIAGLFQQTYAKGKTKFERLGLEFFENIRAQEPARFILQRDKAGGELLAFMLLFHLGERVVNKFIGLDYRRPGRTFLYFRLFEAALDFAYSKGARELQSGQTGYRAKLDLGHRLVPLYNFLRHRNPVVNAVYRAALSRVGWKTLDNDLAAFLRAHPSQGDGRV